MSAAEEAEAAKLDAELEAAVADVGGAAGEDDGEIGAMQEELKALEEEADKLLQAQEIQSPSEAAAVDTTEEERAESDARSIHISNCDYTATEKELEEHFSPCGEIARVMIKRHKFTKKPMGFGYLEFTDKDSVELALGLHESLFKGRQISVAKKRTNIAGFSGGRGGGRSGGRRGRGRGRGRGGRGRAFYGGYRGGGRGGYRPY